MWKYSSLPPNPNEIITNLLKMNYKLYKCIYPITITKIFILKILFLQKNHELYIFRLMESFYKDDKKN
jgi:hypothetical protein